MPSGVIGQLLQRLVITILLTITFTPKRISSIPQTWTYDLTDIKCFTSNPDFLESELEIVRVSRGVFAISGYYDIKGDIDDSYVMEGLMLRRVNPGDEYQTLPFRIRNETFSNAMNNFYKPYMMNSIQECAKNAPYFEKFKGPLKKVYIKADKCPLSIDNFPSHLPDGSYKIVMMIHGANEVCVETYFEVMRNIF